MNGTGGVAALGGVIALVTAGCGGVSTGAATGGPHRCPYRLSVTDPAGDPIDQDDGRAEPEVSNADIVRVRVGTRRRRLCLALETRSPIKPHSAVVLLYRAVSHADSSGGDVFGFLQEFRVTVEENGRFKLETVDPSDELRPVPGTVVAAGNELRLSLPPAAFRPGAPPLTHFAFSVLEGWVPDADAIVDSVPDGAGDSIRFPQGTHCNPVCA